MADAASALAEALAAEQLRIVASLIRTTGDWDLAEDSVADAAERALRRWPVDGIPDNPAAWLTTTARRRAIDVLRRASVERDKLAEVAQLDVAHDPVEQPAIEDDRLRLVFTCCHPALAMDARVALTLKVVSGLSTAAIARSFLTSEATMGQRLLRAKQKIAHAGIPYRVPSPELLPERLDGVLAVIYLVFTEGWSSTGDRALTEEAIRLGRLVCELLPEPDEPRGLLALMLLQHSRRDARQVDGELVTLEAQDRSLWDRAMIAEAIGLLATGLGPYRLQARLAALHASARTAADTDWTAMVTTYDDLLSLTPSPVIALNRAIAVGMGDGPLAGLSALDDLADEPRLAGRHLLPAARGDLLARAGLVDEARAELEAAVELAPSEAEKRALLRRIEALKGGR